MRKFSNVLRIGSELTAAQLAWPRNLRRVIGVLIG
jgi:hypothetical protein